MAHSEFNQHSIDAMLSKILVRQEADAEKREEFRTEIRARFDRGAIRMDAQDLVLKAIEEQARKTNGRVTRIEDSEINKRLELLELAEIAYRNEAARRKGALWVIGGLAGFLNAVVFTVVAWWLGKR